MNAAQALRRSRIRAGLTQRELAERAGTSQATLSAYESGRKQPIVATLDRLLAAAGARLTVEPAGSRTVAVGEEELARRGERLLDVLRLAEALPSKHDPQLRYPPLVKVVQGSR